MKSTAIYLDYAAATPLDPVVKKVMEPYLTENFYNPSASYMAAKKIKADIELSRKKVAYWLGAKPAEIVFTAGATEANNLAIHGIMREYPKGNIVISSIEHDSVTGSASNYEIKIVKVNSDGRVNLDELDRLIDENTVLVSIMHANNEIGTIEPIREASRIINAKRQERKNNSWPLYFHTDSAQAANYLDLHVARLGVDLMSLNGGKIYGPKQSGALYVKSTVILEPLIYGGGQEKGLRSGTENVVGIIGFSEALDIAQKSRHIESKRLMDLQKYFISQLANIGPGIELNGSVKYRLPNNIHITIAGVDNERLLIALDEIGIMAAAGSACSASSEEPSHVLSAIGKTKEEARSSLRLSMGRYIKKEDLINTLKALKNLTNKNV